MWTGKSDLKTPRVDVAFFKKGRKNLYFHTKTDMCWQGLNVKGPLNLSGHVFYKSANEEVFIINGLTDEEKFESLS